MSSNKKLPPEVLAWFREKGREGGLKGAPARMEKLTPAKRKRIAKNAARARWGDKKKGGAGDKKVL